MSYYKPYCAIFGMSFLALINTLGFLMIGGFIATLIILFMQYEAARNGVSGSFSVGGYDMEDQGIEIMTKDEFITYKRIALLAWVGWALISMCVAGAEKSIFVYMGEKLSYTIRMELL